ncbi:hypothetical protein SASPL_146459 [Salvia splendens]|uniref:YegS/DAGK C-terminal domain-containing protein n=1 Tax=Salvia splendens TaxID=180675 RepID=A0A8X8Z576_SALSN|nr:hypothetical protein SASPL_146459 [Salvia splendens]
MKPFGLWICQNSMELFALAEMEFLVEVLLSGLLSLEDWEKDTSWSSTCRNWKWHDKAIKSYGELPDLEKNIIIDDESATKSVDGLVRDPSYGYQGPKAAPHAEFSDGCLDLIMINKSPKLPLLKLMSELNSEGHVKSPHVSEF